MCAARRSNMPNTTRPSPTFESIDLASLAGVQGGCGKKQSCTCAPQAVAIAAPPPPPPAPVAPAPAPRPSTDVSTSVSVSYQ